MLAALSQLVPSKDDVGAAAKTVAKIACVTQAGHHGVRALGWIVVTFVAWRLTRGAEDYVDLVGEIVEVEDSHELVDVTVDETQADRTFHPAMIKPGFEAETKTDTIERTRSDGTRAYENRYSCHGPTVGYTDASGASPTLRCAVRPGVCPASTPTVVVHNDGRRECVYDSKPPLKCRINKDGPWCHYRGECPPDGSTVKRAKRHKNGALRCVEGQWNTCKLRVRYVPPGKSSTREQTFSVPLDVAGAVKFRDGDELPVYYSRHKRKAYLHDWHSGSVVGFGMGLLVLFTVARTGHALLFLHPMGCAVLTGGTVFKTMSKKTGLGLFE
jgi:hypothetical protein